MNQGVISVGTNSTRALVAAINGSARILLTRSTGTRIGEGLKERGHLEDEAVRRTLEAIREHVTAARDLNPEICAIATSALRRADNGEAFARQVQEITGASLEIISGEEEARRSFLGAVSGIDDAAGKTFGVLDVGGGSAEFAVGTKAQPEHITSCEIGAVRLTEAVPELAGTSGRVAEASMERARNLVREKTAAIPDFPAVNSVVCVGGSATTAVSIQRGNRDLFSYAPLSREQLDSLMCRLRSLDLNERKALAGMNPQRADILLAGLTIIDVVLEQSQQERALVSTNDLLLGTLLLSRRHA